MPCEIWTEPLKVFIHSGGMWQAMFLSPRVLICSKSFRFVWLVNQLDFFELGFRAKHGNSDVTPYREDVFGGVMTQSPYTFSRNKL